MLLAEFKGRYQEDLPAADAERCRILHNDRERALGSLRERAFEMQGDYGATNQPQTPADIARALLQMDPDSLLLPDHPVSNVPADDVWHRESLDLWRRAKTMCDINRSLPRLPERPERSRNRLISLIKWCEQCAETVTGLESLVTAFDEFYFTLDATTIPSAGGTRTVGGGANAIALSETAIALHQELGATWRRLCQHHGQRRNASQLGIMFTESDSPTGPWTAIPESSVNAFSVPIGGVGADPVLVSALENATRVVGLPIAVIPTAKPAVDRPRFRAGEVISVNDLAVLESAAKLLRLRAPQATPQVSPEQLVQAKSAAMEGASKANANHAPANQHAEGEERKSGSVTLTNVTKLTSGERFVWDALYGKVMTAAELALLPGLNTDDCVIREHVKNIRLCLKTHQIADRSPQ